MKFDYPVPSHFQFSGRDGSGTGIPSDPAGDYGSVAGIDVHDPWSDTCVGGRGSGCSLFFLLEFTGRIDGSKRITAGIRLHRSVRPFILIRSLVKN